MTTKEKIIFESLKLFSTEGYESVSTRQIAKTIGASDSVIYKHFKSKQEILNSIVEICRQRFIEKSSVFITGDLDWDALGDICLGMFKFQTGDEWIVPFRKLLLIEQFKNDELMKIYRKFFIDSPIDAMTGIFAKLMEQGWIKKGNPKVYSMELYAPFFLHHTLEVDDEVIQNLEEHVKNFRLNVIADEHKQWLMNKMKESKKKAKKSE